MSNGSSRELAGKAYLVNRASFEDEKQREGLVQTLHSSCLLLDL